MVTDRTGANDEKAPSQIEPDKPGRDKAQQDSSPPSDQPKGRPQHEAADPDDDAH
jgi:hypothetical protein